MLNEAPPVDGNATVVNENDPQPQRTTTYRPCVRFDSSTTLQSPCFWILVGAVGAALTFYLINRRNSL